MGQKKKILYLITQSEMGGAQVYIKDLAKNLKDEFNIVVAVGEQKNDDWLTKEMSKENIRFIVLHNVKRAISPFYDFLGLLEIIKLIKKERPDVIHLNSSKISILGSLAGKIYKMSKTSSVNEAKATAKVLAEDLLGAGGKEILDEIKQNRENNPNQDKQNESVTF